MPQPRTRSHSISGTLSRDFFDGHLSLSPLEGHEQASLHSSQTSLGSTGTKSNWKLLQLQYFKPNSNTRSTPSRTADCQPIQPLVISRPRAIVRKSLSVPPPVPKDKPSKNGKVKHRDPDSDDQDTLVSGVDVPSRYHSKMKSGTPKDESKPEKPSPSSRISRKILPVIHGMSDDEDQDEKAESSSDFRSRPKSVHWGLRSSLYQPEFIIEKEEDTVVEPFTSLSPPTFHGRKKGAFKSG